MYQRRDLRVAALLIVPLLVLLMTGYAAAQGGFRLPGTLEQEGDVPALKGKVVCISCQLPDATAALIADHLRNGHQPALRLTNGRVVTILPQGAAYDALRKDAMLGKTVQVKGKTYKGTDLLGIEEFKELVGANP
ncbi:MAG: hypothetical protein HYY96_03220 [Candidatus Tectomicrobia bacterium]|nr:hypothetical protein [Candidatus Tectomicrobia bacterium]